MVEDDESSDEEYDFGAEHVSEKMYPLHDCCEFGDVEALMVRTYERTNERVVGAAAADLSLFTVGRRECCCLEIYFYFLAVLDVK